MNIMIFGGCGAIGSHVVDLLHKNSGNQLFIFDDLSTGKLENIRPLISTKHNTRIRFEMLDIVNRAHVDDAFHRFQPDVVILMAEMEGDARGEAEVNILGTLNVIDAAKRLGARRIVFTSTSAVYRERWWGKARETDTPCPTTPYGISKLAAENYLRTLFPESVILRLGNVYGPRLEGGLSARMIRHFKFGDEFQIYGDGRQARDWVYVEDVARAVKLAMTGKLGTYNIGKGKRISVNEVARAMEEIYEVRDYKWERRGEAGARAGMCLDIRAAEESLDWVPEVTLSEGLKRTMDWWNNTPPEQPEVIKLPIAYEVLV